jgi:hypothetical protein
MSAALAMFSQLNTDMLLPLMRQALGRSISSAADKANFDPPLHHMACIASLKEPDLKPTAASIKPYLNLFHAGFVVAADERDFSEILEVAGMPSVLVDTLQRDTKCAFITGTVAQWRDALLRGGVSTVSSSTRHIYNDIYREFSRLGLATAMELTVSQERPDRTFLIEYKR